MIVVGQYPSQPAPCVSDRSVKPIHTKNFTEMQEHPNQREQRQIQVSDLVLCYVLVEDENLNTND